MPGEEPVSSHHAPRDGPGDPVPGEEPVSSHHAPRDGVGDPAPAELAAALAGPIPATLELFRRHPLARWVESQFGIEPEEGGRLRRRVPQTLAAAAQRLAESTATEQGACAERLREVLNRGGELRAQRRWAGVCVQAAPVHRAGTGALRHPRAGRRRAFSLEGQIVAEGGRIFVPVKFCRQCGQDYYHALRADSRFLPHPVGIEGDPDSQAGHLMLAPAENDWNVGRVPAEWLDRRGRLTSTWRDRVPTPVWVAPDGTYESQPREGAAKMWWQASPFALCLNCGEYYTRREREFGKLATLSSEARSSATTVLATSLLRHCRAPAPRATSCFRLPIIARMPRCKRATSTTSSTCRCFARRFTRPLYATAS